MSGCACQQAVADTTGQRRALTLALVLNTVMFVVECGAGLVAHSSALLADGLDMLSDASVYALALLAIGRSAVFKHRTAMVSGVALALLGAGVIADGVRRWLSGGEPQAGLMLLVTLVALGVNVYVLCLLKPYRDDEVHLRASWIFTRGDIIANLGVLLAALLVMMTSSRWPDLLAGVAIGLYVLKEAAEILRAARAGIGGGEVAH